MLLVTVSRDPLPHIMDQVECRDELYARVALTEKVLTQVGLVTHQNTKTPQTSGSHSQNTSSAGAPTKIGWTVIGVSWRRQTGFCAPLQGGMPHNHEPIVVYTVIRNRRQTNQPTSERMLCTQRDHSAQASMTMFRFRLSVRRDLVQISPH